MVEFLEAYGRIGERTVRPSKLWGDQADVLIADDDDGHLYAYRYTGDMRAAAATIAGKVAERLNMDGRFFELDAVNRRVTRAYGNAWLIDDSGDATLNVEAFPDAVYA